MKHIIYKNTFKLIIVLAILVNSCKKADEWLDKPKPDGQVSYDALFNSVIEIDQLINGSYASALGFAGNGLAFAANYVATLSGDFIAPYPGNYSQIDGIFLSMYQRKNSILYWSDHARVLQYCSKPENICNRVIEEVESGRYNEDPDYNVLGPQLLGEAYLFRAMINFEYTRYFGAQYHSSTINDKAWLYRKNYISSIESARKSRETVGNSYRFLIEDCKKAIENLPLEYDPAKHIATYNANRFTKDAAIALLAQVYFQQNDFVNARDQVNLLLGTSPGTPSQYPLEQVGSGFPEDIYYRTQIETYGRSKNQEVIFAFHGKCGTTPMSSNNPRLKEFVPKPEDINIGASRSEITGTGKWTMSDYFINYVNFDTLNDQRYLKLLDKIVMKDGKSYWWPLKYSKSYDINVLWFRSAEFLLMRAECNARLGNSTDAIADLNAIRTRAGLSSYTGSSDDSGNLIQDIIKERARELFLEKYRIWELLRLGSIDGTKISQGDRLLKPSGLDGIDAIFTGPGLLDWNSSVWRFPIPDSEFLYNPDALN